MTRRRRGEARRLDAVVAISAADTAEETAEAALVALKAGTSPLAVINAAFAAGYRRGYDAAIEEAP